MDCKHLKALEDESIYIIREAIAQSDNPVMLYSMGKDSSVMLHLARKACYPAKLPFPLLYIDTTWSFQAMTHFRDMIAAKLGIKIISYTNPEAIEKNITPFTHSSEWYTHAMITEALKQALTLYAFDVVLGGARRDEEKSRAKERICSFRDSHYHWDPKKQRPELWHLYNMKKKQGESFRVFPLSNWTELDIWQYIHQENIDIVPLYFAAPRQVINRDGTWLMVDDDRMSLKSGEEITKKLVRYRTLGCYPLTGAIESTAKNVPEIIEEMLVNTYSERQGRLIDCDTAASMEKKKQEGYF